jgi:hypothetical protein
MQLERIYHFIHQHLTSIDFEQLWPGFRSVKFAVYDDTQCFFDGQLIPKSDEFLANTSILYQGEYIAIWKITEDESTIDFDVLTSKLVHEMFHAFQQLSHENRYPNELEAVQRYRYEGGNLSAKLHEAKLLKDCLERHSESTFKAFLQSRQGRCQTYPYEATYEAQIEQIEGSAQYVELLALVQLNAKKGRLAWERVVDSIQDPQRYFPIRVVSYAIGAVVLRVLEEYQLKDSVIQSALPFALAMVEDVEPSSQPILHHEAMEQHITAYRSVTSTIIQKALEKQETVLEGDYPLLGLNVYNARCEGKFVTSTYFVMVEVEGQSKVLSGDFVIELNEHGRVFRVYRQT